jgi:hypothetical protein
LIVIAACQPPVIATAQLESGPHAVGCERMPTGCGDSTRLIAVTFLGVAGFSIEHRGHVLLTGPSFSNPSLSKVTPRVSRLLRSSPRIAADTLAIDSLLPASADRATAILIGHGHYDHLMDVPYIATRRATSARIYGGPTIRHMLMGDSTLRAGNGTRVVAIPTADAGTREHPGRWYYSDDSAFRFMALMSSHAPTFRAWKATYLFSSGTLDADLESLPHTAPEWKLGEPYAYIIDVLSTTTRATVFRIYFQDAPSEPPLGFPSDDLLADRRVDLAILCAATSSNVSNTPDSLLTVLKPSQVIVGHWEDFFRQQTRPILVSPGTNLLAFIMSLNNSLRGTRWVMPLPQTTFRFREVDRE